jgi:hypothetical protein
MASLSRSFAILFIFAVTLHPTVSSADEVCALWAKYIWEFTPQAEVRATDVKKVNVRESIGGLFEKSSAAYPFPGVPRALDRVLGEKIKAKVKTLYNRYVLLDRRIDDLWRDRFNHDGSALQQFFDEREQVVHEMSQVAHEAKTDLVAWGVREQDCFTEFENVARKEGGKSSKEMAELRKVKDSCIGQTAAVEDELGNRVPASTQHTPIQDRGSLEIFNSTY